MDDPLVSLTIYESKVTKSKNTTAVRQQKITPPTTSSTSKKNQPLKASEKSKGPSSKSNRTRKVGGVAQSSHRSAEKPSTSGECFPCLPGIEDEKEMSLSSDSSDVASPSHTSEDRVSQDACGLLNSPLPPPPQDFWLMRLFQSNLFNMSIAIGYLFNSKEEDVQAYLGNKLFVSVCVM